MIFNGISVTIPSMILQTVMLLPLSSLLSQQILIEVTALPLYQQAMVPTYAYSSVDFYSPLLGGGSMLDDGMLSGDETDAQIGVLDVPPEGTAEAKSKAGDGRLRFMVVIGNI